MTNQLDDKDDDLVNVVEPDENEWKKLIDEMKYVRALEYVLQNAPVRAKDPEKKRKAAHMALSTMMKIKASEIPDAVNGIPAPLRDTLMKYVYKGFENPKDYSSSALLTWHEKVLAATGLGSIMTWFQKFITLSPKKRGFHLITEEVLREVPEIKQIEIGLMNVFIQHTSASLTINENAAPDVRVDMETIFNKLVPESNSYEHLDEGSDDMPAHAKCALLGSSVNIPITAGRLAFGTWQGIYLYDKVSKDEHEPTEEIYDDQFPKNVHIMKTNNQLRELHTLLRDRTTCRSDFKFYADRLIRLTVEAALDQLPYIPYSVITPTGHCFEGLRHEKGTLCVSLMRSGEAMEKGIRECCRSIRIGKILINEGHVIYAKLPSDVHRRRLLVAYPVITTGSTVLTGLEVLLKEYQCKQSNIILITLFSTPDGLQRICELHPELTIVVSEVNTVAPNHFGQKYFGTD
ncbi:unnamed protein product [Adineta ricciae]|uniref:Phosphoribosyltransferase domain-containing protein n=1 Tax=Adineta ricciae TaxID=249248 RepID=A0A813WEY0_ADIRI|nr:unnamed protein product [Adineta ricciae]